MNRKIYIWVVAIILMLAGVLTAITLKDGRVVEKIDDTRCSITTTEIQERTKPDVLREITFLQNEIARLQKQLDAALEIYAVFD